MDELNDTLLTLERALERATGESIRNEIRAGCLQHRVKRLEQELLAKDKTIADLKRVSEGDFKQAQLSIQDLILKAESEIFDNIRLTEDERAVISSVIVQLIQAITFKMEHTP